MRDWLKVIRLDWPGIASVNNGSSEVKVSELCEEFKEVFGHDLGSIKDYKAKLIVKEGAHPCFCHPRPVPFAIKPGVGEELNRLVNQRINAHLLHGVYVYVDSSKWAIPIVVVPKKNGRLRVCGDYKITINPHLEDFLMVYRVFRATPHATTDCSPSTLFFGRAIKTSIDLLKPNLRLRVETKQLHQKCRYDRRSSVKSYTIGQAVWA